MSESSTPSEEVAPRECRPTKYTSRSSASSAHAGSYSGPFSNPVFKLISLTNGQVNRMTKDEIKQKLLDLRVDTRGVKEVLKKRLKNFYRKQNLFKARLKNAEVVANYLLVIDYEATCQENNSNYPHEIIEFPIVLISTDDGTIVDEFHEYCRPQMNPELTPFCTSLTGITQDTVDNASCFPDVLSRVELWLQSHQLGAEKSFHVVTDGPWDMGRFLHAQCNQSRIPFPRWARKWINVRKAYRNYYGFRSAKLTTMLVNLGMEFEGHLHSGIDDARNIARVVLRMLADGCEFHPNEKIFTHKLKENKKILIDVVAVTKETDASSEDDVTPLDSGLDESELSYAYQGQEVVSAPSLRECRQNGPDQVAAAAGVAAPAADQDEDDISDLLYYMKLKQQCKLNN